MRYKQAFLGVLWALIRPILNMVLFTLIFSKIADLPSAGVNYSLFVLSGMLPWQLWSGAVLEGHQIFINQTRLVSKVYFPRFLLPIAQIAVHMVDFSIGLLLLSSLACFLSDFSFWVPFCLIPFIALVVLLTAGTNLWLSALTVKYRDFKFIVPFFIQLGMFLSPVGYGSFMIPKKLIWFYMLNPMVGIIDGFRWAFFGVTTPYLLVSIVFSSIISTTIFIFGFCYFKSVDQTLVDQL